MVSEKASIKVPEKLWRRNWRWKIESSTCITVPGNAFQKLRQLRNTPSSSPFVQVLVRMIHCPSTPLSSQPGSLCRTPLSPLTVMSCKLCPGEYEVSYMPVTTGPHQLRVTVGDVAVASKKGGQGANAPPTFQKGGQGANAPPTFQKGGHTFYNL